VGHREPQRKCGITGRFGVALLWGGHRDYIFVGTKNIMAQLQSKAISFMISAAGGKAIIPYKTAIISNLINPTSQ
jgi:hypothetical protein